MIRRLRASCTGLYIVLRSLRRPSAMVAAPYVALLLTVARYGFPSGNDASPSLPNSSHVVAPSHAADAASGGSNMTAFPSVLDPSGRSHSSPPSSPRCSVVEPTAGIAVNRSATSSDHTAAQVGFYLCNSGVGSATFFDASLEWLSYGYGYSDESLLTWSATRFINEFILFCVFNRAKDAVVSCGAVLWWFVLHVRNWLLVATCDIAYCADMVLSNVLFVVTCALDVTIYAISCIVSSVVSVVRLAFILSHLVLRLLLDAVRFATLTTLLGIARVSLITIDASMAMLRASAAAVGMSCHLPRLAAFHVAEALLRWRDTHCCEELKIARRIIYGKVTGRTRSQRDEDGRLWLLPWSSF